MSIAIIPNKCQLSIRLKRFLSDVVRLFSCHTSENKHFSLQTAALFNRLMEQAIIFILKGYLLYSSFIILFRPLLIFIDLSLKKLHLILSYFFMKNNNIFFLS